MYRARKIILYTLIGLLIAFEIVTGHLNYTDRGYFAGLGAMLIDIWLIPAITGLLLGVREGLNDWQTYKYSFIRGLLEAAAVLLSHALVSSMIYALTVGSSDISDFVEAIEVFPFWSLGVGYAFYFAAILLTKLIYRLICEFIKFRKVQKERKSD